MKIRLGASAFILLAIALYFIAEPRQGGLDFNDESLQRILASKSPHLQKKIHDLVFPKSFYQDRKTSDAVRKPSEVENLIYELAPQLWWHSQENQAQSDPFDFLHRSELRFYQSYTGFSLYPKTDQLVMAEGKINAETLAKNYSQSLLRPFEKKGLDEGRSGYYLNYKGPEETVLRNPLTSEKSLQKAPLFWRVSRHPDIELLQNQDPNAVILLLEFWYHSVSNPIPTYLGSHQGDWESFAFLVHFKISNPNQKLTYKVLKIYLSAHTQGRWACPSEAEKSEGTDPVRFQLYSALGTHATYLHAGAGDMGLLKDHMEKGIPWETWKWLSPLQLEPYYGFSGAWGKAHFHWSMTGPVPPGPHYKNLPNMEKFSFDAFECP